MKGIVFNLLQEVVEDHHGAETWEQFVDEADASGAYTALGSYEDQELLALVGVASDALDQDEQTVVRWFGEEAFPRLVQRYPEFVEDHDRLIPFLLTLNDIIHPEVRKLYPGAYAPDFDFERPSDDVLELGYDSKRGLCAFAEGLVFGAADHFGTAVDVSQPICVHDGDDRCVLRCDVEAA